MDDFVLVLQKWTVFSQRDWLYFSTDEALYVSTREGLYFFTKKGLYFSTKEKLFFPVGNDCIFLQGKDCIFLNTAKNLKYLMNTICSYRSIEEILWRKYMYLFTIYLVIIMILWKDCLMFFLQWKDCIFLNFVKKFQIFTGPYSYHFTEEILWRKFMYHYIFIYISFVLSWFWNYICKPREL